MVSPLVAEAMAVQRGTQLTVSKNLRPFQIEMDSLQVVNLVNNGVPSSTDVGPVLYDILDSLKLLFGCSISHVPRRPSRLSWMFVGATKE
ncbi:hypothetical protein Ddye_021549 [Dipteronia dyeriana]|uniref:RNase H type-1 domain-containing protein n=1 Tax=Dipteronia dyeriana TaxID=168575 RepID=A0AAD9U2W4_9ROSI|nr:hypothetical protein Ddye_021549 [Dipteronia dyeriana]